MSEATEKTDAPPDGKTANEKPTPAAVAPAAAAPDSAPATRSMSRDFRNPATDPQAFGKAAEKVMRLNAQAEESFNPQFGDARNDRFKVVSPIPQSRAVIGGVLLLGGVGYTGDAKAANLCRGRGMEVTDRNPPERHAPPPSQTNVAHDKKHPPKKGE